MIKERQRQIELNRGGDVTSFDFKSISRAVGLSENMTGLAVLDIGSCFSTFTLGAQGRGAVLALGLDRGYTDIKGLNELFEARIRLWSFSWPEGVAEEQMANKKEFLDNLTEARYVAGLGGFLPFREGAFDLAIAVNSLSTFYLKDPQVLSVQVQEAMRVLRNGGELRMFPWPGQKRSEWTKKQRSNAALLGEELKEIGMEVFIEGKDRKIDPYLRLVKR